ncbi:MAG: phosphoenolpyruvate carboxykinase (GTP) [Candidatus Thermoplasmatota archaeon]|jgi:phosphoenolpyruvate carboxykinase (GTP)|nr:phosphoenolpyruvate carboxykinase (GTP) [Candidatus Thermoplasmatota archaeon]MCL5785053.1 phosphoenolpyruvate carboxykinase (GTP) [Candidatus Thermoplasmatota archaeon]
MLNLGSFEGDQEISRSVASSLQESEFAIRLKKLNPSVYDKIASAIETAHSLCQPSSVEIIDRDSQITSIKKHLANSGILVPLNPSYNPGSYLYRSSPLDVARTEKDTYICTHGSEGDAGPTNNWMDSSTAWGKITPILDASMEGKRMYVVPYWLGPSGSPLGQAGIEISDSPYVVANLTIIARYGTQIVDSFASRNNFTIGIHATLSLDPRNRYICHFVDENEGDGIIVSVNSNYGGNALLSKKCHALRIASVKGRNEGWMAEHMMLIGVKEPNGTVTYVSGAFPSSSGKTNLSMLDPPAEMKNSGWSTELISDDIIWMHEKDGFLHAVNPEYGFFGVAPQTSERTNPNAMKAISSNTIFTNVALDSAGRPYWEGMRERPAGLINWKGEPAKAGEDAAHPNSRFTTPIRQYPYLSPRYDDPQGVPVSAFLYGGRRKDLVPLVFEAYNWQEGVLIGAMQRVETTAATVGKVGMLRNDPMAMRPFTGYNMADYFAHHLKMGKTVRNPPRIYNVNWFRKNPDGKFMWPGYGNNAYVIRWILDRVHGKKVAVKKTPIGITPDPDSFDVNNIVDRNVLRTLLAVDARAFLAELEETESFFRTFGRNFPDKLRESLLAMRERLQSA